MAALTCLNLLLPSNAPRIFQGRAYPMPAACRSQTAAQVFPAATNFFPGKARIGSHNSKAIHRAYAKKAQIIVPSLEEYEKKAAAAIPQQATTA
jgi:hypothetical protein